MQQDVISNFKEKLMKSYTLQQMLYCNLNSCDELSPPHPKQLTNDNLY